MNIRAEGYDWAVQDSLEISERMEELALLQRMLTCPPLNETGNAFHCSVHVAVDIPAIPYDYRPVR